VNPIGGDDEGRPNAEKRKRNSSVTAQLHLPFRKISDQRKARHGISSVGRFLCLCTRTRTNTSPNGTEANAVSRSLRACVARESKLIILCRP
jgi:hypothetical protein